MADALAWVNVRSGKDFRIASFWIRGLTAPHVRGVMPGQRVPATGKGLDHSYPGAEN
jgi:hypothetical protein